MWKDAGSDNFRCLRCGGQMVHAFTEHIQLGKTGLLLGDWPNILAGAMLTEIYCCKECGKLEFFAARKDEAVDENIPQVTCPVCGKPHDFDWPRCPFCKHEY